LGRQLSFSRVGLGLAALGRPGYINLGRAEDLHDDRSVDAMERRCHAMLDAAYAAGVRYVDAARSYGLAETFLAHWLDARGIGAGTITIGSKWGYTYTAGWTTDAAVHEIKDHSLATLRRQLSETRALLGDRLDLYQIHSATLESGVLADLDVLGELARLAADGLVIGLSVSGPRQAATIRRALSVDLDGINPFRCVQATWNVLEPSAGDALAEAHARGWQVIVKEGVANGRLTDRASGPHIEILRRISRELNANIDAVALAAVLAQPWVGAALSGAVTLEQLASNICAADLRLTLEHWEQLTGLAEAPDQYWKERSQLPWA
jgi:aryl-alcohol dehydrogenase-like predicted oxidoreductase